jgi:hypothetical protein
VRWFRRHYGAGPLHLLGLLAAFAVAGYVASRIAGVPLAMRIGIWFVAGVIAHDLLLWPLYTVVDRVAVVAARRHPERLPKVPWINHLRVSVVLSAVWLMISFPLVLRLTPGSYRSATGLTPDVYLGRWLLLSAIAFGASAVIYAVRLGRAVRRERTPRTAPGAQPGPAGRAPTL